MPIKMEPVQSSNIAALGYDPDGEILHVEFHGGALWEFTEITAGHYASLRNAPSIGGYFQRFIRGRFNGRKLRDREPAKTDEKLADGLRQSIADLRAIHDRTMEAQHPAPFTEAAMTINGTPLTVGQSMTIRVALENFASDLVDLDLDPIGPKYKACIDEIRALLVGGAK